MTHPQDNSKGTDRNLGKIPNPPADGTIYSFDAILVLGAAVWIDGPSPTLKRRADHAAALWWKGFAPKIIASGGLGSHSPTEAQAIKTQLMKSGVPSNAILLEDRSTTTFENIQFCLPILEAEGLRHVTIVTDLTHCPRAALTAWGLGLSARTSSPTLAGARWRTLAYQTARETFALPAYALRLSRLRLRRRNAKN